MDRRIWLYSTLVFAIILATAVTASPVLAAAETTQGASWTDMIELMLAVPAAAAAIITAILMWRHRHLDRNKKELELEEIRTRLAKIPGLPEADVMGIAGPIAAGRESQQLILRFVQFYIVLRLWGFFNDVFGSALTGVMLSAEAAEMSILDNPVVMPLFWAVSSSPKLVTWALVLGLGWPLLKDVNRYLGVRMVKAGS